MMKVSITILFIIISIFIFGQETKEKKPSYYIYDTTFNENGIPICSNTKSPSNIIADSSFFKKINGKIIKKIVYEYNGIWLHKNEDKGDRYEYTFRDYKGELKEKVVYKSSINNNAPSQVLSSSCDDCPKNKAPQPCMKYGEIKKIISYKYNDLGSLIEFSTNHSCIYSYRPSKLNSYFKYDTFGKLTEVKAIWYDSVTPNTYTKTNFKYDQKGYLIEEVCDYKFYPFRELDSFQKFTYNIDERNRLIERAEYNISGELIKKDYISKVNYMKRGGILKTYLEAYIY